MVNEQSCSGGQGERDSLDIPFLTFGDFSVEEYAKYLAPDTSAVKFQRCVKDFAPATVTCKVEKCDVKNNEENCKIENDNSTELPLQNDSQNLKTDDTCNEDVEFAEEAPGSPTIREASVADEDVTKDCLQVEEQPHNDIATQEDVQETSQDPPETKPVKQKPTTWAALFKSGPSGPCPKAPTIVSVQMEQSVQAESNTSTKENTEHSHVPVLKDAKAKALSDFLQKSSLHLGSTALQLRGLINNGNWCYINATLQSLLGCSAFYRLFKSMGPFKQKSGNALSTPMTYTMIEFVNEFSTIDHKAQPYKGKKVDDLKLGPSFEPKQVHEILSGLKTTLSESGKQQDAEEFLTFLLNGLHEEFVSLSNLSQNLVKNSTNKHQKEKLINGAVSDELKSKGNEEEVSDHDWEHVGRNNKSATLRKTSDNETLITKLFGGVIRSSVQHAGAKESASLQPFFTIQLDIQAENIWNIKDAFENYFTKENLEGFTSSKTNSEVEASHKTSLEKLPRVLILHLKYFIYDKTGGCQKSHKAIEIARELEIPTDVLSPNLKGRVPASHRKYDLFAIEFHHGKIAAGGHYTTAVRHKEPLGWVYCNDNILQKTQFNQIFKHNKEKVPYLLFYERSNTAGN